MKYLSSLHLYFSNYSKKKKKNRKECFQIILMPKPDKDDKDSTYIHTPISLMDKVAKYQPTKFDSTVKGSHSTINWDISQGCKDISVSTN